MDPLTPENLSTHLAAFADGELNAAQTVALWSFLENHPERVEALERLRQQQQLTNAAKRSFTTTVPAELRSRIAALVASETSLPSGGSSERALTISLRSQGWRARTRLPIAIAAGLLLGISITAFTMRATPAREVLPAALVVKVGRVHAECSRLPESFHDATFESIDPPLAATVQTSLGGATAAPDLSAAGFRLIGAGPCHGAGPVTVHLLYRAADPRKPNAVSLFCQSDAGQFPSLAAGRVYRVSSPTSPFPMLAWRDHSVVYILLADDESSISNVLDLIHPTPSSQIITVASR